MGKILKGRLLLLDLKRYFSVIAVAYDFLFYLRTFR